MPFLAEPPLLKASALAAVEKWLKIALALVSAGFVLLFLYTAARRIHYPYSLDQIEGGMLISVWRIAHGAPLYTPPTLDFVPYLYTPVYFYLAAGLAKFTGISYFTLRLVSILGTCGAMGVLFAFVYRETRSALPSLAAAGFFAACYHPLGGWFDIARVDSLFIFFLLLALYYTRRGPILLAVLIWIVAFQTKQGVLPIALLIFCAEWRRPRRMLLGMGSLIVGIGASILLLNHATSGWYNFYVFGSTRGLGWVWRQAIFYIPVDFLLPFGLTLLLVMAAICFAPPAVRTRNVDFYLLVSFAVYASIWYLRGHGGSSQNTLMPAYAWTAVLFGIALHRLQTWLAGQGSHAAQVCGVLVLIAAIMQLVAHVYHPGRYVPSSSIRQARGAVIEQLRAIPGDIYVVAHADDAYFAGKQPHAVIDAFGLIIHGPPTAGRAALMHDFQQAVDSHRFSAFVFDTLRTEEDLKSVPLPVNILTEYPVHVQVPGGDVVDVTSTQPREAWIYLPCSALDQDISGVLSVSRDVTYGNCPNAPKTIANKP